METLDAMWARIEQVVPRQEPAAAIAALFAPHISSFMRTAARDIRGPKRPGATELTPWRRGAA
ncbi:hypothetical protein OG596_34600 [Streptomyces sp. NBC_01102]|uniref:hypothetical protein n=1 Tax=unclassified Streptomyces TaxID=2593676 RepID=UPI00386D1C7B|nr:hypothetical protein OG596_34600 [Streptomyces sp. NBC_01102]